MQKIRVYQRHDRELHWNLHPYASSAPTLPSYSESKIYCNILARNSGWFRVLGYLKCLIEDVCFSDERDKLLGRAEVNGSRNSSICEQRVLQWWLRVAERWCSLLRYKKKTSGLPITGGKWYLQPLVPLFPSKTLLKVVKKYVTDTGCRGCVYCSQIMTLINFSLHFKGRICISIISVFFLWQYFSSIVEV